MRSMSRFFLAGLALVSVTAFVHAQDSAAPKPAPADRVAAPASELPAIPFADGRATAPQPAAAQKPGTITTEELTSGKTVQAPVNASTVEAVGSFPPAANAAPVKAVQAQPPPVNPAAIQTGEGMNETQGKKGLRGWIVLGIVVALIFGSVVRYRGRLPKRFRSTPAADVALEPEPAAVRAN